MFRLCLAAFVVATALAADTDPQSISCEKGDGFYVLGCNHQFYRCHLGKSIQYDCPSDLYFDSQKGRCGYKKDVMECMTPERFAGVLIKTPGDFNCAGRKDGQYSHPERPCAREFHTCVNGRWSTTDCPFNQYYNIQNNRCDYKENVPACKNTEKNFQSKKINGKYPNPYGAPEVATPAALDTGAPAPPPSVDLQAKVVITGSSEKPRLDCVTLGDGVYKDPTEKCAIHFWKCANQRLFKYECPKERNLHYDFETNRCDHKEFIPECGGVRPPTTPAPALDTTPVDFDCSGKADGFYEKARCQDKFYSCIGGFAKMIKCSEGLVYDLRVKQCDFADNCNGERPALPSPPPAGSSADHGAMNQEKPTEQPINFDCTGKKDGFYMVDKCVSTYAQCSSGTVYAQTCPSGLLFNHFAGRCDYPKDCNSATPTPPPTTTPMPLPPAPAPTPAPLPAAAPSQPAAPYQQPAPVPPMPVSPMKPAPLLAPTTVTPAPILPGRDDVIPLSCENLENGAHAQAPCNQEYVLCWNKIATPAKCQDSLIFNPYNGQCDYSSAVPECNGGKALLPPATPSPMVKPLPVITGAAPPAPPPPAIETDTFCINQRDGYYGNGCQTFFYYCNNGKTYKMNCPSDLLYDIEKKSCELREEIVLCGGKPRPTPPPALLPQSPPQISQAQYGGNSINIAPRPLPTPAPILPILPSPPTPSPTIIPAPANAQPIVFDCTGKKDGLYSLPTCSDSFIHCWNEQTKISNCQSGLFYNEQNGMCDYKENVVKCGGRPQVTSVNTLAAQSQPLPSVFSCENRIDGYYSDGCSTSYYTCIRGIKHNMSCIANLKFSQTDQRCEYELNVPECGGGNKLAPAPAQQQPLSAPLIPNLRPSTNEIQFNCQGRQDGYYSFDKCSPRYASCLAGKVTMGSCGAPLIYNIANGNCDFKESVQACQEAPATTPAPLLAADSQAIAFNCAGQLDGYYPASLCSSNFITCTMGTKTIGACTNNLIYNGQTGKCDWKSNVLGCAQPQTLPAQPALPPSQPQLLPQRAPAVTPSTATPAPLLKPPQSVLSPCLNKADGFYQNGCQSAYLACTKGISYQFNCPVGLIFSQQTSKCEYPSMVENCH